MLKNKKHSHAGLTVLELLIVVGLIALLSMLALPTYMDLQLKAKISEARKNLGAIRIDEEAFKTEHDYYFGPIPLYPPVSPEKKVWTSADTRFSMLGFEITGKVYFSYAVTEREPETFRDNFRAVAYGDLDGDGIWSYFSITKNSIKVVQHTGKVVF